jgi:molybdopterin-containing oxidoreductase family iron-sulfur binding subunit
MRMTGPRLPRFDDLDTSPGRRGVLRAAGASLALAAAAGCDVKPEEWGHPLHARPRGVPLEDATYATVLELDGIGRGVLVRTRAGHPVKVEGNPDHPGSLGATDVFLESAVLSLHDPARSRQVRRSGRVPRGAEATSPELAIAALRGEGLRILTGSRHSPTTARLVAAVLAAQPGARWHQWSPGRGRCGAGRGDARLRRAGGGAERPLARGVPARARHRAARPRAGAAPSGARLGGGAGSWAQGRAHARHHRGRDNARPDRRAGRPAARPAPAGIEALARAVARSSGLPGAAAAIQRQAPSPAHCAARARPRSSRRGGNNRPRSTPSPRR